MPMWQSWQSGMVVIALSPKHGDLDRPILPCHSTAHGQIRPIATSPWHAKTTGPRGFAALPDFGLDFLLLSAIAVRGIEHGRRHRQTAHRERGGAPRPRWLRRGAACGGPLWVWNDQRRDRGPRRV